MILTATLAAFCTSPLARRLFRICLANLRQCQELVGFANAEAIRTQLLEAVMSRSEPTIRFGRFLANAPLKDGDADNGNSQERRKEGLPTYGRPGEETCGNREATTVREVSCLDVVNCHYDKFK